MSWLGYKRENRGLGTAKAKGLSAVSPRPVQEDREPTGGAPLQEG